MFYILFFGTLFLYFSSADLAQDTSKFVYQQRSYGHLVPAPNNLLPYFNATYYEKPDNVMIVPISQNNEEMQVKKHPKKKSPKRTIQKIIKKNRKSKKLLFRRVTTQPTQAAAKIVKEEPFVPDENIDLEDSAPTTQVNQKKKARRWNTKVSRFPVPFQRLQQRHDGSNFKRFRRETDRDNTLILEDFDEMEFVNHKKDYDTVKLHSKKYW